MKNRIWVLLAAMTALSGSLFAAEFASGKRVSFDESSGRVVMEGATINASGRLKVSSDIAEYRMEERGDPRVVDLKGNVRVVAGEQVVLADVATFYPQASMLTSSAVSLANVGGARSVITYTCDKGKLKADGVPVSGNSVCHGHMLITCGGRGGNEVQVTFLIEDCPVE